MAHGLLGSPLFRPALQFAQIAPEPVGIGRIAGSPADRRWSPNAPVPLVHLSGFDVPPGLVVGSGGRGPGPSSSQSDGGGHGSVFAPSPSPPSGLRCDGGNLSAAVGYCDLVGTGLQFSWWHRECRRWFFGSDGIGEHIDDESVAVEFVAR